MHPRTDPGVAFDAVLVLGKELRRDRARGLRELRARSAAAAAAWRAGARRVLSLEARLTGQERSGSAIVAELLSELGVARPALILRAATRSTREEALLARDLCTEHGLGRLLVLTHAYHVARSRRYFDELFGPGGSAVYTPTALWRRARPQERAWIAAAHPDHQTMRREGRVERLFTGLGQALAPLPPALRHDLEVRAGAWLRGVGDAAGD